MSGPAAKSICFMPRRPDTTRAAFRAYYEDRHTPLAIPLFGFSRYRRNHLVDQAVEPGFDCLSEFWVDSFARIGALMAGPTGDTMRADERTFTDQPAILPALASEALSAEGEVRTLLLLTREGGDDEALIAACRAVGAGLDLLAPMDLRPLPHDAIAYLTGGLPALPAGWRAAPALAVETCETAPAALGG